MSCRESLCSNLLFIFLFHSVDIFNVDIFDLFFFWEDLCHKRFGQNVVPRLEKSYNLTEINVIFKKHFYFPVEAMHARTGFKLKVSECPLPEEFVRVEGWTSQPQPLPSPRSKICEEAMPGVTGETASPPQPGRTDPLTNSQPPLASHVISSNTKFYAVLITSLDFWHDFLIVCVFVGLGLVWFFVE